jgi:hypothetical protein
MYRPEREIYYKKLLSIYSRYILNDMITGMYNGALVYIDTDNRMMYSLDGQAILQFRH